MTRASRFAGVAGCVLVVYLLFLFEILRVPFIPQDISRAILPTVRTFR